MEGGAQLLQAFLDAGLWDEARVFTGAKFLFKGIPAPIIPVAPAYPQVIAGDLLEVFFNRL